MNKLLTGISMTDEKDIFDVDTFLEDFGLEI